MTNKNIPISDVLCSPLNPAGLWIKTLRVISSQNDSTNLMFYIPAGFYHISTNIYVRYDAL